MNVINIPKNFVAQGDLVLIPRKEYEHLVRSQKNIQTIYTKKSTILADFDKRSKETKAQYKKGIATVWKKGSLIK